MKAGASSTSVQSSASIANPPQPLTQTIPAGHIKANYHGEETPPVHRPPFRYTIPYNYPSVALGSALQHCPRLSDSCEWGCLNSLTGFHHVENRWRSTPPLHQLHYQSSVLYLRERVKEKKRVRERRRLTPV